MEIIAKVRGQGSSMVISIPKEITELVGINPGDFVSFPGIKILKRKELGLQDAPFPYSEYIGGFPNKIICQQ